MFRINVPQKSANLNRTGIEYVSNGYRMGKETFFLNQLAFRSEVCCPAQGDFNVDGKYLFEVGGKTKTFEQIKDVQNGFLAIDGIEIGSRNRIPLWLFDFLY